VISRSFRPVSININVAVSWQQAATGDWSTYATEVSRRTAQEINEVKR
jgi:hypothetical protein